jgi:hypothetical protein
MSLTKAHNRMIEGAPVNVKDYGAVGDGVTDDSTAIQNAVNAAVDEVFIPAGTYKMESPVEVPHNISIRGAGKGKTIAQAVSGTSGNFSFRDFSTTPTAKHSLFNFLPGAVPLELPTAASDLSKFDYEIDFTSAHGLEEGDLIVINDFTKQLLVENVTGTFTVGETVTGGTSGATGTIREVEHTTHEDGTVYARIRYEALGGEFTPNDNSGSDPTETVTGGTSGATATSICAGGSFNAYRYYYDDGEFLTVAHKTDTQITVNGCIQESYLSNSIKVWHIRQPSKGSIKDMSIIGSGERTTYPFGVSVFCSKGFVVENLELRDFNYDHIEINLSFGSIIRGCYIEQNMDADGTPMSTYGIQSSNNQNLQIRDCTLSSATHAITVGGYSFQTNFPNPVNRQVTVEGCYIDDLYNSEAISMHGNTVDCTFRDNKIIGGISLSGKRNTIENNDIWGYGNASGGTAIMMSEACSNENYILNNRIYGRGGEKTEERGLLFLAPKNNKKRGAVESGKPLIVRGNRIVFEYTGVYPSSSVVKIGDYHGVGFTGTYRIHFEDNTIYNECNNGIKLWVDAVDSNEIMENVTIRNNTFRGKGQAVSVEYEDSSSLPQVRNIIFNGNYIDADGESTIQYPAVLLNAEDTIQVVGNTIEQCSLGGFRVEIVDTQTQPVVFEHNKVFDFGYATPTSSTTDNGAFNFWKKSGGTSGKDVFFRYNEVVTAQSTAVYGVRSRYCNLVTTDNKFEFTAPTGGNWLGYYSISAGSRLYETIDSETLMLRESTTPTAETSFGKIYTKSDNKLYFQDGAGTEHEISFV